MSRLGIKKMRRKITQSVRTACKFRYIVTYEYLEVKSQENWKPTELNILWFRGHRTKSSIKPTWSIQIPNQIKKETTCTAKWNPPYSVELLVTLYKDINGTSFRKKDYMFVMEDISGSKRKKLAIFPCNLATYVSMDGEVSDLEMEFKTLSTKVISAKCGLKIRCEFIKEGTSIDDDMQSNFSHMSESEEFSRMSELAEVSDEDDFNEDSKSIPEIDEPEPDENYLENDLEPWQENDLEKQTVEPDKETFSDAALTTTKSKPWSKFVAEINSFEWKQVSLRNPLGSSKKKRIADQLKEKQTACTESKGDEDPVAGCAEYEIQGHHDKQLIKVPSLDKDGLKDQVVLDNEDTLDEDFVDEDDKTGSTGSLSTCGRSRNGLKTSLKETLKNVTSKTTKELEAKLEEKTNKIWTLEHENKDLTKDNKELVVENNRLQDEVFKFQKQRDELQSEISELQILVEDLKTQLSQSEAEHKQLQEEEKELLARTNLHGWLCKRGIKGLTGRQWRRRWFATDKSGKLYYYKQNNNSTPQGFIDLDHIMSVQDQSEDKQDKNKASFNVIVDKRKYELMAHDSEEKQKWINALDYLRHWRSHTTKSLTASKPTADDYDEALNPFK